MKRFEALLPIHSAPEIIDQLSALQLESLITTGVTVIDRNNPRKMIHRGCVYNDCASTRLKVELTVFDADADAAESLLDEASV